MNIDAVRSVLAERHEPPFRLPQIKRAFYVEYLDSWDKVTTLSKATREALSAEVTWDALKCVRTQTSEDGNTIKKLFECEDGKKIEAVLMRHGDGRNTVCISCQVGCPMGCTFCATGTMGFIRNLTPDEIVEQVIAFARLVKEEKAHITNVVFMGMGEPMHAYPEVMKAVHMINDPEGINLGARHITISTCGIVPGILKLADEKVQVNLAISLHAANNATRSKLMPVNKAYPIEKLMKAIDVYTEKTNRKVFFEYLLINGVNDSEQDAEDLATLLGHNGRLFHVNLIKYHDTNAFTATAKERRVSFMHWLQRLGVQVTHRLTFGEDIDAACGQLAVNEAAGMLEQGKVAAQSNRTKRA